MTGLEALKEFKGNNNTMLVGRVMGKQHYLDCLKVMEKTLKALEIIKEKEVDIEYIKKESTTFEGFNRWIEFIDSIGINIPKNRNRQLTEEEFNILKEVLE